MTKRFIQAAMIALWLAAVLIASTCYGGTLVIKDGNGQAQQMNVQADPGGALSSRMIVCDGSNPDNCGPVSTTGGPTVTPVQATASLLNATVSQGTAASLNATVVQATGSNLHMVCDSGCSVGTLGLLDEGAFTPGGTTIIPSGGFYQTSATSNPLTTGQAGSVQLTQYRAVMTNLRNVSGTEIGTASTPLQVSIANTAANSTPIVDTATLNQAGSALSNTNGIWANILTGNAAVAAGNPVYTTQVPTNAGGLSIQSAIVANNTTSVAVGSSAAHQLYGIDGFSIATTNPVYIKLYNAAQGSTTCGSGTPVARYMIPASGGSSGSGEIMHDANGIAFGTALTYCITGGIADADTTSPSASTYIVNLLYK